MRRCGGWLLCLCIVPSGPFCGSTRRGLAMRRWAAAGASRGSAWQQAWQEEWQQGWQSEYAGSSRWQSRRVNVPEGKESADSSESLWYFGFGANINPWKLREKRGIIPIEQVCGKLPGWQLTFNHKGGMGNIEQVGSSMLASDGPGEVHGILLYLSKHHFLRLSQMEYEYGTVEVHVNAYDGRNIAAKAFITPAEWKLPQGVPPPLRYLKLIQEGCEAMGIDASYQDWLKSVQSQKGERGPEYWAVPSRAKKPRPEQKESDNLRLPALKRFAIDGLVDIGANLGKCSAQDLAAQLVRAAAANVSHIILTGCSMKGSKDAQRICDEWSRPAARDRATQQLGAAAGFEMDQLPIVQLPMLMFTAGVHPHDAKSCNDRTVGFLESLASDSRCVAIGECGLDYDRMFSPRDVQLHWCRKQIELAMRLGMPLFLHERDRDSSKGKPLGSAADLKKILQDCNVESKKVCIHCFTGPAEDLQEYIGKGYFIGLTGFAGMKKRGAHIRQLLATGALPLQQLMIETDCPFMLPDKEYLPDSLGIAGRKNEPCCMPAVCRAIAECLEVPPQKVAQVTTSNALRFFGI
ncbi:unnamed protein product [Effrenium voratum]|uniref:Uncharacterized protein n=1 Tax=Effrenium voratum TaxID=2562239 RepID=A0AA36NLV0_9DINO|nr:unnamed protein product [Effrenium voratum]CAJ1442222.1 unnamed protein product [Effrenium voratum]CAJ1454438.1 unnamed protein product [Effrenium voratum]